MSGTAPRPPEVCPAALTGLGKTRTPVIPITVGRELPTSLRKERSNEDRMRQDEEVEKRGRVQDLKPHFKLFQKPDSKQL